MNRIFFAGISECIFGIAAVWFAWVALWFYPNLSASGDYVLPYPLVLGIYVGLPSIAFLISLVLLLNSFRSFKEKASILPSVGAIIAAASIFFYLYILYFTFLS